jgi:hypothetical protein
MAFYAEFSSLLQLGVGIGIGLSIFRAPVDVRVSGIGRRLNNEISALKGVNTDFAKKKRRDLMDLKLRFISICSKLDKVLIPFLIATVLGAGINLAGLIKVTLDGQSVASPFWCWLFLTSSVGYFLSIAFALEIVARVMLSTIRNDLQAIQSRRG